MVKIVSRLILIAIVGMLGFWLWTELFPSPEKIVLKKISALAATATFGANDGTFTRAGKASNLIGYFSTDCEISYDVSGLGSHTFSSRDEIREAAAGVYANVASLKVQFTDAVAHVAADKQSVEVTCTARIALGDYKDYGIQELRVQFKKIDHDWLITRVETVKTLQ